MRDYTKIIINSEIIALHITISHLQKRMMVSWFLLETSSHQLILAALNTNHLHELFTKIPRNSPS